MLLYIISLILIASGLAFTFVFETMFMQIIGVFMSVLGIAILIAYYQKALKGLSKDNKTIKNRLDLCLKQQESNEKNLNDQVRLKDEEIMRLDNSLNKSKKTPPIFSPNASLEQRLEDLRSFLVENFDVDNNYPRFFSELNRAVQNQTMRKKLLNNCINPLKQKVKDTSLPLDDESSKLDLLAELVQLAFVAVDYMQEYRSTYDGEAPLSVRMAVHDISQKEAADMATKANTNPNETELVYRVLLELVTALGINNKTLIVHNYLLQ